MLMNDVVTKKIFKDDDDEVVDLPIQPTRQMTDFC